MQNNKEKLVSVSIKDCLVIPYNGTGAGGQHRNKKQNSIRIFHKPSGAEGRCENYREQIRNKREAFKRMTETLKFKSWLQIEVSKKLGVIKNIEQKVEKEMEKIIIEVKDENGRWTKE